VRHHTPQSTVLYSTWRRNGSGQKSPGYCKEKTPPRKSGGKIDRFDQYKNATKPQWKGKKCVYDFGNGDVVVITVSEDEYYEDGYYEDEYYLNDDTTVWDTTITTERREALKRKQEMESRDRATQTYPMEFPSCSH
jgi:hypothetical protein